METVKNKLENNTSQTILIDLSYSQILKNLGTNIIADNTTKTATFCCNTQTNLYYLSQRYYDPETYQFLSKDPVKADGEESAYQYCGGEPVNNVDPSGQFFLRNGYVYEYKIVWLGWLNIRVLTVGGFADNWYKGKKRYLGIRAVYKWQINYGWRFKRLTLYRFGKRIWAEKKWHYCGYTYRRRRIVSFQYALFSRYYSFFKYSQED